MKHTKRWMVIGSAVLVISACNKNNGGGDGTAGNNHVYIINNADKANKLMDFKRAGDGTLKLDSVYDAGGSGTGAALGSQGAVAIADDGTVLVVNAGSNSISSFRRGAHGLVKQSTVSTGGTVPISVATYNNAVVVLNSGGAGNLSGFTLSFGGSLSAVAGSIHALVDSAATAAPAEVAFVNNGTALVVTEKGANKITSYNSNGYSHSLTSANTTPYGFAVGGNGNIYVSEAAGGAANASTVSSYHIANDGAIKLVTGPVKANQSAACWVALTENEKYAFVSNTGSNTMTSVSVNSYTGGININQASAGTTGSKPADAAITGNYLYVLTADGNSLNCFKINQNGGLTSIQTVTGIAASAVGMAAN